MKRSTPGIEVLRAGAEEYIKPFYHIQLDQIDNLSRKTI